MSENHGFVHDEIVVQPATPTGGQVGNNCSFVEFSTSFSLRMEIKQAAERDQSILVLLQLKLS